MAITKPQTNDATGTGSTLTETCVWGFDRFSYRVRSPGPISSGSKQWSYVSAGDGHFLGHYSRRSFAL